MSACANHELPEAQHTLTVSLSFLFFFVIFFNPDLPVTSHTQTLSIFWGSFGVVKITKKVGVGEVGVGEDFS